MKTLFLVVFLVIFSKSVLANQRIEIIVDYANFLNFQKICKKTDFNENCFDFKETMKVRELAENLAIDSYVSTLPVSIYKPLVYQETNDFVMEYSIPIQVLMVGEYYGYHSNEYRVVKENYLLEKMEDRMRFSPVNRKFASYDANGNWVFSATKKAGYCSLNGIEYTVICRPVELMNENNRIISSILLENDFQFFSYSDCKGTICKRGALNVNSPTIKLLSLYFGYNSKIVENSRKLYIFSSLANLLSNEESFDVNIISDYILTRN